MTSTRAQAQTDPTPRLYVKVLPVTEVKPGDVIRYRSRGRRPSTLSMAVERAVDCGASDAGPHVHLFRADERVDVLRPLTAAEDAKVHEGLVKA